MHRTRKSLSQFSAIGCLLSLSDYSGQLQKLSQLVGEQCCSCHHHSWNRNQQQLQCSWGAHESLPTKRRQGRVWQVRMMCRRRAGGIFLSLPKYMKNQPRSRLKTFTHCHIHQSFPIPHRSKASALKNVNQVTIIAFSFIILMPRAWKGGQGEPSRILLWLASNAICTFHWPPEGEENHRMNMGGLYHHQKKRSTRKEQMGEDEKRKAFQRSEFIAVVSSAFHRFRLSTCTEEGKEVFTASSRGCGTFPGVSTTQKVSPRNCSIIDFQGWQWWEHQFCKHERKRTHLMDLSTFTWLVLYWGQGQSPHSPQQAFATGLCSCSCISE